MRKIKHYFDYDFIDLLLLILEYTGIKFFLVSASEFIYSMFIVLISAIILTITIFYLSRYLLTSKFCNSQLSIVHFCILYILIPLFYFIFVPILNTPACFSDSEDIVSQYIIYHFFLFLPYHILLVWYILIIFDIEPFNIIDVLLKGLRQFKPKEPVLEKFKDFIGRFFVFKTLFENANKQQTPIVDSSKIPFYRLFFKSSRNKDHFGDQSK